MITLLGDVKSTQHCYKVVCRGKFPSVYMSADCKSIKEDYIIQAKQQWKEAPLDTRIRLKMALWFKDKRKRDIDNYNKLVLDALSGIVYVDDELIYEIEITKGICKDNPRVEIEVEVINNEL